MVGGRRLRSSWVVKVGMRGGEGEDGVWKGVDDDVTTTAAVQGAQGGSGGTRADLQEKQQRT